MVNKNRIHSLVLEWGDMVANVLLAGTLFGINQKTNFTFFGFAPNRNSCWCLSHFKVTEERIMGKTTKFCKMIRFHWNYLKFYKIQEKREKKIGKHSYIKRILWPWTDIKFNFWMIFTAIQHKLLIINYNTEKLIK